LEAKPWFPGFNEWKDLFYLRPIVSRPQSRGRLWLASTDPTHPPQIDPRYLSEPDDMRVLRDGFRIAREVAQQRPLDAFRGEELNPGPRCSTSAQINAHIRKTATTVQHACGTCRVGRDSGAVVDAKLGVYGVERLRIVDASVMPTILNCNIHAAVLAIAEWASDLIRGRSLLQPEGDRS
ncbi:GMC oxidoreductase, partial [Variovorax sp. HJSM1_2]|uniref:GMC oxidoreductase n=1 Tax=Variovorax sp. HJSM1_2 TaxID=3366263 RepID=UPI003BBE4A2A